MALGKRIRYYREKKQWTLDKLAEMSDVEIGTISALEQRDSRRSAFAPQIAKAFGLTVERLLDETVDWLEPVNTSYVARESSPVPYVSARAWPFSAELFDAVVKLEASEIRRLENVLRSSLNVATLPPFAAKRAAA